LEKNSVAVDVLNSNRQLWQMAGGADPDTLANPSELTVEQCRVTVQVLHSMLEKHGPNGGLDSFVEDIDKAVKMLRVASLDLRASCACFRIDSFCHGFARCCHSGWDAIRVERFPLTPLGVFEELVRNTQSIISRWNSDAKRREVRMQAQLEDNEEQGDDGRNCEGGEQQAPHPEEPLRPYDRYGLDIDGEFRHKRHSRFLHWEEVAKTANEVILDEMRTLLELHYDDVAGECLRGKRRKQKNIFASAAYAHRHRLNQKIILPTRVKDILRKPADEENWGKLRLLCEAVRCEVERIEDVYLNSERDVEELARAVEKCTSARYGDEVGDGFKAVPEGSRLIVDIDHDDREAHEVRLEVAALVRMVEPGSAVAARLRPMGTMRQSPLDKPGMHLMQRKQCGKTVWYRAPFIRFESYVEERAAPDIRDALLVQLWAALFLTACEHWSEGGYSNTSATDAMELGFWFYRGGEIGKEPLFGGICVRDSVLIWVQHATT